MNPVFDSPGWAPAGGSPELAALLERLTALSGRGMTLGLQRIRAALNRLGNPQDSFRSVNIAGSNGKGSTSAFLANILAASGYKVGLYSSPHLELVTERIRVWPDQTEGVDEASLIRWVDEVEGVDPGFETLSFFEVMTAAAFVGFRERKVDFAVVEAGLGARYDATRVIESEVAVLTAVSLEHTQILGETIEEVTREEAFVMRSGRPLIACARPGPIRNTVAAMAADSDVTPRYLGEDFTASVKADGVAIETEAMSISGLQLGLRGRHQIDNAALALAAALVLDPQLSEESVRNGLKDTRWPGRLETFVVEGVRVLLDGGQNAYAAQTLAAALAAEEQGAFQTVFACMTDKDATAMLTALEPHTAAWFFCYAPSPRSADPASFVAKGFSGHVLADPWDALAAAMKAAQAADTAVLVTGSLYLVGRIRQRLRAL